MMEIDNDEEHIHDGDYMMSSKRNMFERKSTIFDNGMSLKKAYENLKTLKPNNEIQDRINHLFKVKLAKHFEKAIDVELIGKSNKLSKKKNVKSLREIANNVNYKLSSKIETRKKGIMVGQKRIITNNQIRDIHDKLEFEF